MEPGLGWAWRPEAAMRKSVLHGDSLEKHRWALEPRECMDAGGRGSGEHGDVRGGRRVSAGTYK